VIGSIGLVWEELFFQLCGCGCAFGLFLLGLFEDVAGELAAFGAAAVGGEELFFAVGFGEWVGVIDGVVGGWGSVTEAVGFVGVAAVGWSVVVGGGWVVKDDLVAVGGTAARGGTSVAGVTSASTDAAAGLSWFRIVVIHACIEVCSLFAIGVLISSSSVFTVVISSALVVAVLTAALASAAPVGEFCSHALDRVGLGMKQVISTCIFRVTSLLVASYCPANMEVRACIWLRIS